jgi:predicted DNA-binding transcriptional regulator AlpA
MALPQLLTKEEVARALRISESSLKRLVRDGQFPEALSVSEGKPYWLEEDVRAYLHLRSRLSKKWPGLAARESVDPPRA